MSENVSTAPVSRPSPGLPAGSGREAAIPGRYLGWLPTWGLITTRHLELRKRRVLMVVSAVLIVGLPVLVLGLRLVFHLADPKSYGPAGSPSVFQSLCDPLANFAFIIAAAIGATVGTSDLSDGMFRHLVITGRSRIALYLARIPAGLSVVLPLVGLAFAMMCLVTSYAGTPQPTSIGVNGASIPVHLDQAQLKTWILDHPEQAANALENGPPVPGGVQALVGTSMTTTYGNYISAENTELNPAVNEMAKIGLWIELDVTIGFIVGLGLGSLIGQRTVPIVLLIILQIIITPALAANVIPYFLDGQRLFVGIPLDQLRPAGMASGGGPGGHGGGIVGRAVFGGSGALGIPLMPTWAMITVIAGWIVGWTGIGAWRMATRDA